VFYVLKLYLSLNILRIYILFTIMFGVMVKIFTKKLLCEVTISAKHGNSRDIFVMLIKNP